MDNVHYYLLLFLLLSIRGIELLNIDKALPEVTEQKHGIDPEHQWYRIGLHIQKTNIEMKIA